MDNSSIKCDNQSPSQQIPVKNDAYQCLPIKAKLRLMHMSDSELWELSEITSCISGIDIESIYSKYRHIINVEANTTKELSREEYYNHLLLSEEDRRNGYNIKIYDHNSITLFLRSINLSCFSLALNEKTIQELIKLIIGLRKP